MDNFFNDETRTMFMDFFSGDEFHASQQQNRDSQPDHLPFLLGDYAQASNNEKHKGGQKTDENLPEAQLVPGMGNSNAPHAADLDEIITELSLSIEGTSSGPQTAPVTPASAYISPSQEVVQLHHDSPPLLVVPPDRGEKRNRLDAATRKRKRTKTRGTAKSPQGKNRTDAEEFVRSTLGDYRRFVRSAKDNPTAPTSLSDVLALPPQILKNYSDLGIEHLFPWQSRILRQRLFMLGKSLVYTAPTSAGKTLVSELAILNMLTKSGPYQRKVLFILPYISVVIEKVEHFKRVFDGVPDIRVEGYYSTMGSKSLGKKTSLAICTIERGLGLVRSLIAEERLSELGMVVVDELHMVSERDRGTTLETLISLLLRHNKAHGKDPHIEDAGAPLLERVESNMDALIALRRRIQIIGMTATIRREDLRRIAEWIGGEFFVGDKRPIELREYVFHNGTVLDRDFGKVREVQVSSLPPLFALIQEPLPSHSVIVFCPSRKKTKELALSFLSKASPEKLSAAGPGVQEARSAIVSQLREIYSSNPDDQSTNINQDLARLVEAGIAYHHSGLTIEARRLLEEGFRGGSIRAIFATSTLSVGINLPARRVIITSPYMGSQRLAHSKYKQMVGRAGRVGLDDFGESFIVCRRKSDWDSIRDTYFTDRKVKTSSQLLCGTGLTDLAFDAIGLGLAKDLRGILFLLECTFAARSAFLSPEDMGIYNFDGGSSESPGDGSCDLFTEAGKWRSDGFLSLAPYFSIKSEIHTRIKVDVFTTSRLVLSAGRDVSDTSCSAGAQKSPSVFFLGQSRIPVVRLNRRKVAGDVIPGRFNLFVMVAFYLERVLMTSKRSAFLNVMLSADKAFSKTTYSRWLDHKAISIEYLKAMISKVFMPNRGAAITNTQTVREFLQTAIPPSRVTDSAVSEMPGYAQVAAPRRLLPLLLAIESLHSRVDKLVESFPIGENRLNTDDRSVELDAVFSDLYWVSLLFVMRVVMWLLEWDGEDERGLIQKGVSRLSEMFRTLGVFRLSAIDRTIEIESPLKSAESLFSVRKHFQSVFRLLELALTGEYIDSGSFVQFSETSCLQSDVMCGIYVDYLGVVSSLRGSSDRIAGVLGVKYCEKDFGEAFFGFSPELASARLSLLEKVAFIRRIKRSVNFLLKNAFIYAQGDGDDLSFRPTLLGDGKFFSLLSFRDSISVYNDIVEASETVRINEELHQLYYFIPHEVPEIRPDWTLFERLVTGMESAASEREFLTVTRSGSYTLSQLGIDSQYIYQMSTSRSRARLAERNRLKHKIHVRFYTTLIIYELFKNPEGNMHRVSQMFSVDLGIMEKLIDSIMINANQVCNFVWKINRRGRFDNILSIFNNLARRIEREIKFDLGDLSEIPDLQYYRAKKLYESGLRSVREISEASVDRVAAAIRIESGPDSRTNAIIGRRIAANIINMCKRIEEMRRAEREELAASLMERLGAVVKRKKKKRPPREGKGVPPPLLMSTQRDGSLVNFMGTQADGAWDSDNDEYADLVARTPRAMESLEFRRRLSFERF